MQAVTELLEGNNIYSLLLLLNSNADKRFSEKALNGASVVAQMVKNLPAMQETWVQTLGGEDSLEKEMTTYSSVLPWRIPWTGEPGGL